MFVLFCSCFILRELKNTKNIKMRGREYQVRSRETLRERWAKGVWNSQIIDKYILKNSNVIRISELISFYLFLFAKFWLISPSLGTVGLSWDYPPPPKKIQKIKISAKKSYFSVMGRIQMDFVKFEVWDDKALICRVQWRSLKTSRERNPGKKIVIAQWCFYRMLSDIKYPIKCFLFWDCQLHHWGAGECPLVGMNAENILCCCPFRIS